MRLAFVSWEYAGQAVGGGIGTYVRNTARMLAARGHDVDVFTAGLETGSSTHDGVQVHTVCASRGQFADAVAERFMAVHRERRFDLVESAEFGADAAGVFARAPEVARIVKLHTASFQLAAMNEAYVSLAHKARFIAGALRRGRRPQPFWNRYDPAGDPELAMALMADEITSPSRAMLDWTRQAWPLAAKPGSVVPNVFDPSPQLLRMPMAGRDPLVVFVGKLETRKGVIELARAIPLILRRVPEARFRFVGRAIAHPATGEMLDRMIARIAGAPARAQTEFTGGVEYTEIAGHLGRAAVAVFPSHWENYPYVCLEAMAAGCAVVGSSAGGMAEMIRDGETGQLVPTREPVALARAIVGLLRNPERRLMLSENARQAVLARNASQVIGPLHEAACARAIAASADRRRARAA